jgi:hypothetical protein
MFATLSSFLPSALQQNSPNPGNSTIKDDPIVHAGETQPTEVVGSDEVGVKRKERKFNHEVRIHLCLLGTPCSHIRT